MSCVTNEPMKKIVLNYHLNRTASTVKADKFAIPKEQLIHTEPIPKKGEYFIVCLHKNSSNRPVCTLVFEDNTKPFCSIKNFSMIKIKPLNRPNFCYDYAIKLEITDPSNGSKTVVDTNFDFTQIKHGELADLHLTYESSFEKLIYPGMSATQINKATTPLRVCRVGFVQ